MITFPDELPKVGQVISYGAAEYTPQALASETLEDAVQAGRPIEIQYWIEATVISREWREEDFACGEFIITTSHPRFNEVRYNPALIPELMWGYRLVPPKDMPEELAQALPFTGMPTPTIIG
jgi:hypothetical protein